MNAIHPMFQFEVQKLVFHQLRYYPVARTNPRKQLRKVFCPNREEVQNPS